MSTPRGAAAAALDRVIHDEQVRNARYAVIIRLVLTTLASIMWFVIPLLERTANALWISRTGTFIYWGVGLVVAAAYYRFPKFRVPSLFGIPLIDVVLISTIHHLQLASLGNDRWMNAPINLIMMFSLIVISTLSLSWVVICLTVVAGAASMIVMLVRCDCEPMSIGLTAMMLPAVAAVTSMLVLRIRSLVRASRQRDLLGKYILGPRLGAGGMAEVFLATYSPEGGFERQVAIKRILPSFSNDATAIALFRREAELGATLAHPNLVHVLDFGSDGETYFLAMELVDGTNLSVIFDHARRQDQGLEPVVVAYIAWCMADALDHVHEHVSASGQHMRLVHRDLNPAQHLGVEIR